MRLGVCLGHNVVIINSSVMQSNQLGVAVGFNMSKQGAAYFKLTMMTLEYKILEQKLFE